MRVPTLTFVLCITSCQPINEAGDRWWTSEDRNLVLSELVRTTRELEAEVQNLSPEQARFREETDRWNIVEIIEHLEMQNQLHFRELSVNVNGPQMLELRAITEGQDGWFVKYATDTINGQANWFLRPKGKYPTLQDAMDAFLLAREKLVEFVSETPADLRKQFTYRAPVYEKSVNKLRIGEVRDLHQLLLTGIAHTDRHLRQIRNIKRHEDYPNQ